MIFALVDYCNYRRGRGRYSAEQLSAANWLHATPEAFSGDNALRPGDAVVVHTKGSLTSWVLMYFQQSPANHNFFVIDNGDIVDVDRTGVHVKRLDHYLTGQYWFCTSQNLAIRNGMTDDQRRASVDFAKGEIGKGYAWHVILYLAVNISTGGGAQREGKKDNLDLIADIVISMVGLVGLGRGLSENPRWGRWILPSYLAIVVLQHVGFRVQLDRPRRLREWRPFARNPLLGTYHVLGGKAQFMNDLMTAIQEGNKSG